LGYYRCWELINEVTNTNWTILEKYGENEITIIALEELENSKERLTVSYSRLYNLMLRIAESQPLANSATLNLLNVTIEQTTAIIASVSASIQEAKKDFDL
jgi:hypothetical protein